MTARVISELRRRTRMQVGAGSGRPPRGDRITPREAKWLAAQAAFRRWGVKESTLCGWEVGGTAPALDGLLASAAFAEVNVDWLAHGVGPKGRDDFVRTLEGARAQTRQQIERALIDAGMRGHEAAVAVSGESLDHWLRRAAEDECDRVIQATATAQRIIRRALEAMIGRSETLPTHQRPPARVLDRWRAVLAAIQSAQRPKPLPAGEWIALCIALLHEVQQQSVASVDFTDPVRGFGVLHDHSAAMLITRSGIQHRDGKGSIGDRLPEILAAPAKWLAPILTALRASTSDRTLRNALWLAGELSAARRS